MSSKLESNRQNALQSSGPKTANGKRNSSRNATKHGFFAEEFLLTDEEKVEYRTLQRTLGEQLQPTTVLQCFAVEKITCCCWRCKLAARLEARRLSVLLETPDDRELKPQEKQDPAKLRWYAASRPDLRCAIRFLTDLKNSFQESGYVHEEWKQPLDTTFGVGFYDSLAKWPSMNLQAILLAEQFINHEQNFGMSPTRPDHQEPAKAVIDPRQSLQMVTKLIEEKLQHLHDLLDSWDGRAFASAAAHNSSLEDFPRFFTSATRDLHRAVEWFVYLKKNNL
jgi:hypothetical protein